MQNDIGKGQFGKVSLATMKNILPGKLESAVAVKMLKGKAIHVWLSSAEMNNYLCMFYIFLKLTYTYVYTHTHTHTATISFQG